MLNNRGNLMKLYLKINTYFNMGSKSRKGKKGKAVANSNAQEFVQDGSSSSPI